MIVLNKNLMKQNLKIIKDTQKLCNKLLRQNLKMMR